MTVTLCAPVAMIIAHVPATPIVIEAMKSIHGFFTLAVALAFLLIALVVEWKTILRYRGIETVSLGDIERYHPRLPGKTEIVIATVFSLVFALLFFQFVTIVYAMTFTLGSSSAETNNTVDVVIGDFDNDGDLDYIAGNSDSGAPLVGWDMYRNDGTATFTHMGTINGASTAFSKFVAADIDGDGDLDLVYGLGTPIYEVGVMKNLGNFTFAKGYSHAYVTEVTGIRDIVVADVDGDGDLDIVVGATTHLSNAVHINDGHGNFTRPPSTLPAVADMVAADFNSDGYIDLALAGGAGTRIYKNTGTGAFYLAGGGYTNMLTLAVADVDGDGDIDVVGTDNNTPANLIQLMNDGTGAFTENSGHILKNSNVADIALADFDNDGDVDFLDVATGGAFNGNELWLNMGGGSFQFHWQAGGSDSTSSSVAVGDLDNDGDLDYVVGRSGTLNPNDRLLSDRAATVANTAPTAPTSLTTTIVSNPAGPRSPATAANDNSIGTISWANTSNIFVQGDGNVASSALTPGATSQYLKATNFGFAIPPTSTILGITVEWNKAKNSGSCDITDAAVRIVKGGVNGTTDKSLATQWPATLSYITYGGPTDLWGLSWTAADINASTFGTAIAAIDNGASCGVSVDHVRITVTYSPEITLRWGSGADTQTSTRLLQYQVRVGTGSNTHNIVSGRTASPNWVSRVMPNGQSRMMKLKGLACGLTYYWAVATVDTGFKATWSPESSFTLDSDCESTPSSPPPPAGGGLSARYFRTNVTDTTSAPGMGVITVTGFNDLNADGVRNSRELAGFKGLAFTASGRTAAGVAVERAATLNEKGETSFELEVSDDRGYWILVDTGSSVLAGFEPTGNTASGGYVLRSGSIAEVGFGFRRLDLLSYKPCLRIGDPTEQEAKGVDAYVLLQRLQDPFGVNVMKGVDLQDGLVTRKEFFTLLVRTQCVPIIRDMTELQTKIREQAKARSMTLPLIDLPLDTARPDSLLVYSLLAAGADIGRETLIGSAADLSSPITRGEALRAVDTVLPIPADKRVTEGGMLPNDLEASDRLTSSFLTLQNLKVLPGSFLPVVGASQGLNLSETAVFIVRAAFSAGKIGLLPEPSAPNKKTATVATFLSVVPALKSRVCLEKNTDRATDISFTDVLPGDPLFEDLRELLTRGTRNSGKQMLWLLPATRRPTEFGILRGQTKAALSEPVSILETIRNLLVLACTPPPTALEVMSGKAKPILQGSAATRVARDRISDLERNSSFPSRTLYRSQDHQQEFDLSLFTYAADLLRAEVRSPGSGLSVIEASRLLASALLMIEVKTKVMSPLAAENAMEELSAAIRRDLTGKDVDWRDESSLKTVPFTRGMLLRFLATVVTGRVSVSSVPVPSTLPLGEIWWERIR